MKYLPFFEIQLLHTYYADDVCPDFLVEPDLATQKLLSNHRCVLKPTFNGAQILMPVEDNLSPFISVKIGTSFTFNLRLQNPDFTLFTDLDTVTLTCETVNPDEAFQIDYPLLPPPEKNILAQVHLQYNASWPNIATGAAQFQIQFGAKQTRWTYYIVAHAQTEASQVQIQDRPSNGVEEQILFSEDNRTDLTQNPDSADRVAQSLAAQYPTQKCFRFVSDDFVSCQQTARKSLQLFLNDEQVVAVLPNPALNHYALVQGDDVLYQVVK